MQYQLTYIKDSIMKQYILVYKSTGQTYSDALDYNDALSIAQSDSDLEMVEYIKPIKAPIDYSALSMY